MGMLETANKNKENNNKLNFGPFKNSKCFEPYSESHFHADIKMVYGLNFHTEIINSRDWCKVCDGGAFPAQINLDTAFTVNMN